MLKRKRKKILEMCFQGEEANRRDYEETFTIRSVLIRRSVMGDKSSHGSDWMWEKKQILSRNLTNFE